jgi:hypothetical protein
MWTKDALAMMLRRKYAMLRGSRKNKTKGQAPAQIATWRALVCQARPGWITD